MLRRSKIFIVIDTQFAASSRRSGISVPTFIDSFTSLWFSLFTIVFLRGFSCSKLCKLLNSELSCSRRYTDTPIRRSHAHCGSGPAALLARLFQQINMQRFGKRFGLQFQLGSPHPRDGL